jgi:hypothetical protein
VEEELEFDRMVAERLQAQPVREVRIIDCGPMTAREQGEAVKRWRKVLMPPPPVNVRITEQAFDMIFEKAGVTGPNRSAPLRRLVKTLSTISKRPRR